MTENQDVPKTEEMNNLKNEIRQRNAVLIDQQTKRQIRDWLEGNPYQELLEYMKSRVMGQENIAIVVANVYNYLKNVSIPDTVMEMPTHCNCNNMILAAPSGSGKTETYRAFQNIKFYSEHTQGMPLFLENVGDVTLYAKTAVGTIKLDLGDRKEVRKENAEAETPSLPNGDLYPAGIIE